jgi:sigma-B regulation protein RsbU (phosphoserine phosphatase)
MDAKLLYQDLVHAVMFLFAAGMTWLIKRQGDRLAAEHRETLEVQAQLQADLDAAHRVQRSLMGQALPDIPSLEMRIGYRSARQVGGDLIDVRRRGVRLGICVADVSGKGAQAALMAVAVKGWLDYVPGRFVSPVEVAEQMNRRLSDCVPLEMFVTFAYFVVNTTSGEVRYTIAGHDPPLVRRATGEIEALGPTGPALGLMADASFEEGTLALKPGDVLLLYTDGLTTAETDQGRTGLEPALALLAQAPPVDALVNGLMRTAVPEHGEPGDDVAILVVKRKD